MRIYIISFLLLSSFSLFAKKSFVPRTFKAEFVKKEKALLSGKDLKSGGKIFYQYPSRIRLEFEGSDKSIFVSNPFKTYYYKPPPFEGVPGELTINKSNNYPLSKFFDTLRSGLTSNDLYKVKKKSKSIAITFTEKGSKELKILNAELFFKKDLLFNELEKVQITLDSEKKLNFEFASISMNPKFDKNLFIFKAPENTRKSR